MYYDETIHIHRFRGDSDQNGCDELGKNGLDFVRLDWKAMGVGGWGEGGTFTS